MSSSLYARWLPGLRLILRGLTQPTASLHDPQERRNARLLSALLTLAIPILLFGALFRGLLHIEEAAFAPPTIWPVVVILLVAYGLSRTAYYRLSAALAIVAVSAVIFLHIISRGIYTADEVSNPAGWLVTLLLFSSFIFSWQITLALGVIYAAALALLPLIVPDISFSDVRFSVELIFALSLVIALASYLRRRDMRMIQAQTEQLAESEDRYRMLFAAAFEGIVIHDDGKVVDVNDALQAMFGYSREEMIGAPVLTYIPPEYHATVFEKASANIMHYELPGLRKDGTRFPMEVGVKRVMYKGKLLRVVAMRDITERKREEAERIELNRERERGQVLRQFIKDASHDLRQPLTTMHTSLYLLRRKSADLGDAMLQVDTLDAQVAHLTRLLEDLFAMARLDEPTFFMERAPLDIDQLVTRVVDEQRPVATQKRLQLDFEPGGGLPTVLVDHVELRRAITHILSNALSYTREGGHVTVRTLQRDKKVVVEIRDNGIGISPEDLPHIFNRFYRADLARQTETGGSGLGLAMAQKIIENHGGTIQVESTLGDGSTFRICLPVPPETEAHSPP